jgi:hypothetical protein
MADRSYNLVLYFDPNRAITQQKVRDCLARLAPMQVDRMETSLQRGRVILKRNAAPEKDQRIIELFAETGAICRFEEKAAKSAQPLPGAGKTRSIQTEMVCPKCNRTQLLATECSHCGLIVGKFKKQIQPVPAPQMPFKSPSESPQTRPRPWAMRKAKYGPSIEKAWTWLKGNPLGNARLQQWSNRLADALFRCVVVFMVALILEIGLLYMAKIVWYVYTATQVGQVYLAKFGGEANSIQHLMQSNPVRVGWQAGITVLIICVLVAIAGQWLHLVRFFYLPFGFLGHTVLWVLPLTAFSAWLLYQVGLTNHIGVSGVVTLLPTFLLLPSCMHLGQTLVPDMGTVIRAARGTTGGLAERFSLLKHSIKKWWDNASRS